MSKDPIGRKVARAAATGSRRKTASSQRPLGWYGAIAAVLILGTSSVWYSRYEYLHPPKPIQPVIGSHWQAAIGFDVCGKILPNLAKPKNATSSGITTQGDGVIQIAPRTAADAGANATLGRFVSNYRGLVLTSSSLRLPGGTTYSNGDKCGNTPASVRIETWDSLAATKGTIYQGNPSSLKFVNGEIIAVGFLPPNAALPEPSSRVALAGGGVQSTTPQPGATKPVVPPAGPAGTLGTAGRPSTAAG